MKTTHTPGPWKVNGISPIGGVLVSTTDNVSDICICDGPSGSGKAEANARLIAAAPDLLAALELAVATIGRLTPRHGQFSSADGTLDVARAAIAIAKARA